MTAVWTFIPPSMEWTPESLPPGRGSVWVVDDFADDPDVPAAASWDGTRWLLATGSDECSITAWTPLTDTAPEVPEHPLCGAVYPIRSGQEPCKKWRDHHLGPDTDWKRDYHSNGLLKWRVDGADMPGDIPLKAASMAVMRATGITGSDRRAFAERLDHDPLGFCDWLAEQVVEAVRHADRVLAGVARESVEWEVRWLADGGGIAMHEQHLISRSEAERLGPTRVGEYNITGWSAHHRTHRSFADGSSWTGPWCGVEGETEVPRG